MLKKMETNNNEFVMKKKINKNGDSKNKEIFSNF